MTTWSIVPLIREKVEIFEKLVNNMVGVTRIVMYVYPPVVMKITAGIHTRCATQTFSTSCTIHKRIVRAGGCTLSAFIALLGK